MKNTLNALTLALVLAPAGASLAAGMDMAGMDMSGKDKGMAMPASPTAKAAAKVKPAKKAKSKAVAAKPAKHQHWVCPMHDGGEGDHAGPCPKCGMAMVLDKDDDAPAAK